MNIFSKDSIFTIAYLVPVYKLAVNEIRIEFYYF